MFCFLKKICITKVQECIDTFNKNATDQNHLKLEVLQESSNIFMLR